MSKRLRDGFSSSVPALITTPAEQFDEDVTLPPTTNTLVFCELTRTPLPSGGNARTLLSRLAAAESIALTASIKARSEFLNDTYTRAAAADAFRQSTAVALEKEAGIEARREAELEAIAASGGALVPGAELSHDAAVAAVDAAATVLRAYGMSAPAETALVIAAGLGSSATTGSPIELPAPSLLGSGVYFGRPLRGATSGVLFLSAERQVGPAPPRHRDTWRYPFDASVVSNAYKQTLVAEYREALKRPLWPDRAHPLGHLSSARVGAGSELTRAVALAASFDDQAADDEMIARMHARTLEALERDVDFD